MKVAVLTSSLDPKDGGWGRYSQEVVSELLKKGYEVTIFTEKRSLRNFYNGVSNVTVRPVLMTNGNTKLSNIKNVLADYFYLKKFQEEFDIFHAFVEHHSISLSLLKIKFIITTHGTYAPLFLKNIFWGLLMRRALKKAAFTIFTSKFTESEVVSLVASKKSFVFIPNGVNTESFSPDDKVVRNPWFVTAGALKSRKGQDIGVRALSNLLPSFPEARYIIVGDRSGPFAKQVESLVVELGIEQAVEFKDTVESSELIQLYRTAYGVVLPSRHTGSSFEGMPLSLLEGAACGTPVIASLGSGAEHLINNGENGFLIKPESVNMLTDKMRSLLEDPDLVEKLGQAARKKAESLSWERHVSDLIDLYTKAQKGDISNV